MSKEYCFLCASDEGVFLDITADNKQIFHEQFEICSFTKVPTIEQLPNKICYKCAYELNQCSTFVQKYKQAVKQRSSTRKQAQKICCCLCHEAGKTKYIFDLSKDKGLQHNSFDKIQKLFNYDLRESPEEHKFICLSCRYTVDLLLDLKNVCTETATKLNAIIGKDIDYLTFPKIKTTVVSRKTTITESGRTNLYVLQESKNNFTDMTRTRSQQNKLTNKKLDEKPKFRICNKCNSSVKTGDDMYRIHNTGKIVCKNCWKSTDIHKNGTEKQVQQNLSETKHCTVFLKDVLRDTEMKERNLYRVDEDNKGNKTYIVMEKEPDKVVDDISNKRGRPVQKRSVKSTKTDNESTDNEYLPNKRSKSEEKERNKMTLEESKPVALRQRKRKTSSNIGQSSDSEPPAAKAVKRGQRALTRHKRATGSSLSDADLDNKHNRKKLRTILRGIPIMANVDANDKSSSNKDEPKRKRTGQTSVPSKLPDANDDDIKESAERYSSVQEVNSEAQDVAKSTTSQETQSPKPDNDRNVFEIQTYVCDECGTSYENRLLGLTHKLSHYKQPKLQLKELSNEIPIKDVTLITAEAADDQSEDPIEAIGITVDDDEEELVEDVNDLNNEAKFNSTTDNKCHSTKKETLEDAVDVELVMKESDDDQVRKVQKETEDEQVDEDTDLDIVNMSIKNLAEEFKVKQTESESSCNNNDKIDQSIHESIKDRNVDSEEKQGIPDSETEDTQEQQKETFKLIKDIQDNSESLMEEVKTIEEKEKIVEEEKEKIVENDGKDDDNEQIKGKEKLVENEGKDDDIEQIKGKEKLIENEGKDGDIEQIKEKEKLVENEGKGDDIEQIKGKEDAEENVESSEAQEEEKAVETDNKNLSKFSKDFDMQTVNKDEDGASDKCRQNNSMNEEVEDGIEKLFDETNDLKQTDDQKSHNESTTQTRADSDSHVSEKILSSEEGSTIDKDSLIVIDEVETSISDASKEEKSMNDSANAAAEVLQEVLDLANAEVQKRQESDTNNGSDAIEAETLENISREIHNIDMLSKEKDDGKNKHSISVK